MPTTPHAGRLAALALTLLAALLAPSTARAQWEPVPLPAQVTEPSQVALFGFAEAFGGHLFVSTGFGIPQTPTSTVYDYVFASHDGGLSWAAVPEFTVDITSTDVRLGRPTVADGALYLPRWTQTGNPTAYASTVLKTTDGTTWTAPAAAGLPAADGPLANVARQDGVLYGLTTTSGGTADVGYVYRSADEGATWTRVGAQRLPGIVYAAGSRLLLGRGQGNTTDGERSADGGTTWTPHGSTIYTAARNTAGVVLTGALSNVQRSTDGGVTFAPIPSTTFGFGGTFALDACGETFVAVAAGVVKRSDDGGTTWAAWSDGLPGDGRNVRLFSCSAGGPAPAGSPSYVYAATYDVSGAGAGVYRRDLSQPAVASEGAPEASDVALTVGPNPASGSMVVRFALGAPATVRLAVVDVLGREVAASEQTLAAGPHAVPLAVAGLAPGVYVVRLESGDRSVSRRLTVAR